MDDSEARDRSPELGAAAEHPAGAEFGPELELERRWQATAPLAPARAALSPPRSAALRPVPRRRRARPRPPRLRPLAVALLLPAAVLALWELSSQRAWVSPVIAPAPARVWSTLSELSRSGELAAQLGVSLLRVAWGLLAAALAGIAIGGSMGLSTRAASYLRPSFRAFSEIPSLAWIPLLIMLLGIDDAMKIAAIAFAAVVPIAAGVQHGIREISPALREVARVCGLRPLAQLRQLVLPAALPSALLGLRHGWNQAWLALVTVELIASSEGIGFQLAWGRQLLQMDVVLACIAVIAAVGLALDQGFAALQLRCARRLGARA